MAFHAIREHGETNRRNIEDGQTESDKAQYMFNEPMTAGRPITIDNPFLTFDDTVLNPRTGKTELEEYVWDFACRSELDDKVRLLIFGARLARDKHEAITRYGGDISARDRLLIDNEKEAGFWQQSKTVRATIMIASLAGSIQGWTQSINNAVNSDMPVDLGLCIGTNKSHCHPSAKDLWTFGMLNAIPLLSAGLFGVIVADPLQERVLGRRGSVMVSTIITITSTIAASMTHTVAQLAGKDQTSVHQAIRILMCISLSSYQWSCFRNQSVHQ
ncbi:hypothetical protein SLS62_002610 [Diatrype stigma]|uniref:Uncharacterized protein n=1 Tax=Diatrype stigma TaxID=117547 RepID=A0AAN9UW85_9PEZI